ncbi:MAG: hypothetical protein RL748_85 [Pseudomonadota bacterium]|jgi:voltage-gated potassium channel
MRARTVRFARSWLLLGLLLSIPAFYLAVTAQQSGYGLWGRVLYGLTALLVVLDISVQMQKNGRRFSAWRRWQPYFLDMLIGVGVLLSACRHDVPWQDGEWVLRLVLVAMIFLRLVLLVAGFVAPHRLTQILTLAVLMVVMAGGVFYWLEPNVHSYADGIWLAFTTVSTLGYGDIVPSTPGARVFAVFIVVLGYALFSIVTATIAALFVGEDEKRLERELHADIRALRQEVAALRESLQNQSAPQEHAVAVQPPLSEATASPPSNSPPSNLPPSTSP